MFYKDLTKGLIKSLKNYIRIYSFCLMCLFNYLNSKHFVPSPKDKNRIYVSSITLVVVWRSNAARGALTKVQPVSRLSKKFFQEKKLREH